MADEKSRQILRPWLEGILYNGGVPGVHWLNSECTQFVIPWPRGGKSCPDQNEKEIFKRWAEHTGRYRVGIDKEDYVRWKTRLRCALNKSKDFEEIIDIENKHPNHKYFRIRNKEQVKSVTMDHLNETMLPIDKHPEIPVCVARENLSESLPSDLQSVRTSDLIDVDVQMLSNQLEEVNINEAGLSQQTGNCSETTVQINLVFIGVSATLMVDTKSYSAGLLINSSKYNPKQNEHKKLWVITDHLDSSLHGLLDIFSDGIYLHQSDNKWIVYNINDHPVYMDGESKDPKSQLEFTDRIVVHDGDLLLFIEIILHKDVNNDTADPICDIPNLKSQDTQF